MSQYDSSQYGFHNLYPLQQTAVNRDERVHSVKRALLTMQRYSWEQGVAAQAMLELGETELVVLMARDAVVRQDDKGRLGIMGDTNSVTDPAANGEAVLFAASVTGDPSFTVASDKMLEWLLHQAPRAANGGLYHITSQKQVWVDSFYMAPPFLAVAGYFDEAVRQIECLRHFLWNPEKKLYAHIWDDENQTFVREVPWGVGNGWAAAGLVRVIRTLPSDMLMEKMRLISYLQEVIDGCLAYLRDDGLFHDVLDNPNTFTETNTAQMLAYAIYHSVLQGWLSPDYMPSADKMRKAAMEKVDRDGIVRGVCGAPFFDREGSAPEGQAFYLLMESAFLSLLLKQRESSREVGK